MYLVTICQDASVQSVNTTIPSSTGIFDAVNTARLIKAGFNVDVRDIGEEPREADACGGKFVTCNSDGSPTFPEIQKFLNGGC